MATSAFKYTLREYESEALVKLVAPADPRRIALGFSVGNVGGMLVAPHPRPEQTGWLASGLDAPRVLWFSLLDHGAMVCEAWYAVESTAKLGVYEVYRLQ